MDKETMKKIIVILFLILVGSTAYSQRILVLLYEGRELSQNEMIRITTIDPEYGIMKFPLAVKNASSSDIQVKVRRSEVSIVEGSLNYFCFGNCYTPEISESFEAINISAGGMVDIFYADYELGTEKGTSEIHYHFFDVNNVKNPTSVIAMFSDNGTGIENISSSGYVNIFSLQNVVSVSYRLEEDQTLIIRDITGKMIDKQIIKAGTKTEKMPMALMNGIYIYSVQGKKGISFAGKFIVH
jgi:hypothetical protein